MFLLWLVLALSGSGASTTGAVAVTSEPAGAAVYVDGAFVGKTPLTVQQVTRGDHRLRLIKDGYVENGRVFSTAAGSTTTMRIRLTPRARVASAQVGPPVFRVVVLEGEDGVNIIDKKTAVQPVVQVLDQNNLPVAGASVLFAIDGRGAAFANGARQLAVTTDGAGRATAAGLNPVSRGPLQIQVRATFQGQTATATVHQTSYATLAAATSAAAAAGTSAGAAAAGAVIAGGGGGGLSAAAIGGIVAGAAGGTLIAVKAATSGGSNGSGTSAGGSGGSSNTSNTLWSVNFSPDINVTPCVPAGSPPVTLCCQAVSVNSVGAFHEIWQSLLQVDGTLTGSTMSAALKCVGSGSTTGNITASQNGSRFDGTATFGAQTVSVRVCLGSQALTCGT